MCIYSLSITHHLLSLSCGHENAGWRKWNARKMHWNGLIWFCTILNNENTNLWIRLHDNVKRIRITGERGEQTKPNVHGLAWLGKCKSIGFFSFCPLESTAHWFWLVSIIAIFFSTNQSSVFRFLKEKHWTKIV